MASFNHNHSGSWPEVGLPGQTLDKSAGLTTESLSWTDIQRALDPTSSLGALDSSSSMNAMNYGKGALARSAAGADFPPINSYDAKADATPAVATPGIQGSPTRMHSNDLNSQFGEGLGLAPSGVSPFRGIVDQADFLHTGKFKIQEVNSSDFHGTFDQGLTAQPVHEMPSRVVLPRANSSLLRLIGNMQKQNADGAQRELPKSITSANETADAKLAIGLAIAPGAEVHDKALVARAKVRLEQNNRADIAPQADVPQMHFGGAQADMPQMHFGTAQPADNATAMKAASEAEAPAINDRKLNAEEIVQARIEQEETRPLADPFRHVFEQHAKIAEKFDGSNCKYGRTTLLPDGRTVTSSTASDNTTLTKTTGENGANSMVVHDRYRRPTTEQETMPDGTWKFSELSYDDSKGIKPFCSQKITVNSDGTMELSKYNKIGQLASKQIFA